MRAPAIVATAVLATACATQPALPPKAEREGKVSYNRRELPPEPGLFTGPDGVWTVYRNDADRPAPAPPRKTTLSCQRGQVCDPPPPDVLVQPGSDAH